MNIITQLRKVRERGYSVSFMSKYLNVNKQTIYNWLSGKQRIRRRYNNMIRTLWYEVRTGKELYF